VGRSQKGGLGVKGPAPAEPAGTAHVTCYGRILSYDSDKIWLQARSQWWAPL
jgi:hypothetical protein